MKGSLYLSLVAAANAVNIARQVITESGDDNTAIDDYFLSVCLPETSSGSPDLNAPCNALEAISTQCLYGSDALWENSTDPRVSSQRVSAQQEQVCFCQSQWFNMFEGCVACANAHGVGGAVPQVSASAMNSFSSSYCAATNTPTGQFEDALNTAFSDAVNAAASQTATTYSDPIGSSTDVSLYFTAPVTGTSAAIVSQAAPTDAATASSAQTTMMVMPNTSNGQIVATGAVSVTSASSTGAAAVATPCLEKIVMAGAAGLVGAVAML